MARSLFVFALLLGAWCLPSCQSARSALAQNNDARACLVATGQKSVHPFFDDDEVAVAHALLKKRKTRFRFKALNKNEFESLLGIEANDDYGKGHALVRMRVEGSRQSLVRLANDAPGDVREQNTPSDLVRAALRYRDVVSLGDITLRAHPEERLKWLEEASSQAAVALAKLDAARAIVPCDEEPCGIYRLLRNDSFLVGAMVAKTGVSCEVSINFALRVFSQEGVSHAVRSLDKISLAAQDQNPTHSVFMQSSEVPVQQLKRYQREAAHVRDDVTNGCVYAFPQSLGGWSQNFCGGCTTCCCSSGGVR